MGTQVREAHSVDDEKLNKQLLKQSILQQIPQFEVDSILRRHHLNRTIIIGLIGNRGDGKSGTGSALSLVDYMFEGWPCFSNMPIRADIVIPDDIARDYYLQTGGKARFETKPLDKAALLRFDPMFKGSLIFADEINMELADARRAMSNTNLFSSNVAQELRKLEAHLIYTVIDEMFIDNRLRSLTDIFFKCEDTALSLEGLEAKQKEGMRIKWIPYAMSGYLAGREKSFYVTKKALEPVYFNLGLFHGIYDDKQLQGEGKKKYGINLEDEDGIGVLDAELEVDTSEQDRQFNEYQWIIDKVRDIRDQGYTSLSKFQLSQILGVVIDRQMSSLLSNFGITWNPIAQSYVVETWQVEESGGGVSRARHYNNNI